MDKIKKHGKNIGNVLIKATPIIGSLKDNFDSEDGGKGKFHWQKIIYSIVRIVGLIFASKYAPEVVNLIP